MPHVNSWNSSELKDQGPTEGARGSPAKPESLHAHAQPPLAEGEEEKHLWVIVAGEESGAGASQWHTRVDS